MDDTRTIGTTASTAEILDIMSMLPHRFPFLLVDRVVEIVNGESAVGIKNVSINEGFFQGHFPGRPVMPGVLLIESMAQTAAVLVVRTLGDEAARRLVYFMSIDDARFRRPVTPGDQVMVHVTVLQSRRNVWRFAAEAKVDGIVVAEAKYAAMIMQSKAN
ncbi:MAG: 3-hydroxyacyl-ACP dehydratase FabZ [Azospirillaceae bacterium]